MHPFFRGKLYKYLILNDINFYPSPLGEKSEFIKVRVRIKVIDTMLLLLDLSQ